MVKFVSRVWWAPLVLVLAQPINADSMADETATYINSTPARYAAMQALPADEPIHMLNLIRYRDKAAYPEGSEYANRGWTGEQAYAEYARRVTPIGENLGAKNLYMGLPEITVIGPESEAWDLVFIVYYPNVNSLFELLADEQYKKHAIHRSAAVADSRLVRMAPAQE